MDTIKTHEHAHSLIFPVQFINLSYSVDESELQAYCEANFGEVKKVIMGRDDKGRSKGYAFVQFISKDAQEKAIQAKEVKISNRLAVVKLPND